MQHLQLVLADVREEGAQLLVVVQGVVWLDRSHGRGKMLKPKFYRARARKKCKGRSVKREHVRRKTRAKS